MAMRNGSRSLTKSYDEITDGGDGLRLHSSANKDILKLHHEWEILEGLRDGQTIHQKPERYQGFLLKRRKWPLKGWHKRLFVVENGIMTYGKSMADIRKGKYHGIVDVGLAVITYKCGACRIDIDAEEQVYHIKVKSQKLFDEWLSKLHHHLLYRQHEIAFGVKESHQQNDVTYISDDNCDTSFCNFKEAECQLHTLQEVLDEIRTLPLAKDFSTENPPVSFAESLSVPLMESTLGQIHTSISIPNLHKPSDRPRSSGHDNAMPVLEYQNRVQEIRLRERFVVLAQEVQGKLSGFLRAMYVAHDRRKSSVEGRLDTGSIPGNHGIALLRQALDEAHNQNNELCSRLARIHADSLVECTLAVPISTSPIAVSSNVSSSQKRDRNYLVHSPSGDSFSMSEYYDAEEHVNNQSEYSSEPSDEEVSSEISEDDNDAECTSEIMLEGLSGVARATGRRSTLPVPKPELPDMSMWSLLYRNIGKDLSKISMPVTLNEPLSMLQRLCEELEYSELLDKASDCEDPWDRMAYVAAFAVSGYASSYFRSGHKPFNPLLGETYECIRADRGWKFIAEQVSHHPPVSACYCESKNFIFQQDMRIKTKFWGKSMEIQPFGCVSITLPKYHDHYKWNKVTTCVHNLMGGQRWVDQYGDMTITNGDIFCRLTFAKGSNSYSAKHCEVFGNIQASDGKVVHELFGQWHEALHCGKEQSARCIWRQGSMPEDFALYYGFTRFAMELNELDAEQSRLLPPTDTRFRPDQRGMEEGRIAEAEAEKLRLENQQRQRIKIAEKTGHHHCPVWFRKKCVDGKEVHEYNGKYWDARKDPGFACMSFVRIF